jgi:hypothetical protein
MKIRNGFVSNSSSTSFLIVLDDKTRKLAHYNYITREEDVVFDNDPKEKENYLLENGFKFIGKGGYGKLSYKKYATESPIAKTNETELSRVTSICFGKELQNYIEYVMQKVEEQPEIFTDLKEMIDSLVKVIYEYGLDNVLFFRSSDENMGGSLPDELIKLESKAVWVHEQH